jgi:dTDP-L-rhamnose 4-epimerase
MSPERVLVTGGAGFIGSFLVDLLIEKGDQVIIYDCLDPQVHPRGKPDYLNPHVEFIQGNVLDRDQFKSVLSRVDVVYHLASAVGVGQSQYQIDHYVSANTQGTARLLDILVNDKVAIRKMIVAASMSSYGEGLYEAPSTSERLRPGLRPVSQMEQGDWEPRHPRTGEALRPVPTPETEHFDENSIYAMTKAHQEAMVLLIGKTYSIPAVATRFFNVYGPRQSLSNPYTGVAAIFMSRIKNDQPPVVYEDGRQTRDFIAVHDLVEALYLVKETNAADYQSLNLGCGVPLEIAEVGRTIARVCGKEIEPAIQNKFRKGDVRHCYADITKARTLLGWKPRVSYEAGIRELVEWSEQVEAIDRFEEATAELKAKGLI